MNLKNKVLETIRQNNLIQPKEKVIVAFSGGPDSVCLLHLLHELKAELDIELYAFHLNHQIRGLDAHRDAWYCLSLCDEYDIPFFVDSTDVPGYAQNMKMSLEEAARDVRYKKLFYLKSILNADKIAVAHNMDDQVETVLMRMMRGTGLYGLKGMEQLLSNGIIRPLLSVQKKEIIEELEQNGIHWQVDTTNQEDNYTRNKIRLSMIPLMEECYPTAKENIFRMSASIREDSQYIEQNAMSFFEENHTLINSNTVKLELDDFFDMDLAIQKRSVRYSINVVLHSLKGIETVHLDSVIQLAKRYGDAQINLPKNLTVYKKQSALYFSTEELKEDILSFFYELEQNETIDISEISTEIETKVLLKDKKFMLSTGAYKKAFDFDKVSGRLFVRSREAGDRIKPMGLEGTKKIKNIFIDAKVPLAERNRIPIICDEAGNILWVVGHCISEEFKIDETTKKVILITVKQEND